VLVNVKVNNGYLSDFRMSWSQT